MLPSSGVIPRVSPTVPTADAVSKRQVSRGRPSIPEIRHPPVRNRNRYMTRTAAAVRTVSSEILRPNILGCALLRNTELSDARRTARVVTLMPPAVEPGAPPVSMRKIIRSLPFSLSTERSRVLKPAVLGVTAFDVTDETATNGLFCGGISAIEGAARWAVAPDANFGKLGICVNHAQFDYYNIQHVYREISTAIATMNPSPLK